MSASITNQHAKREVEFMGFIGLSRKLTDLLVSATPKPSLTMRLPFNYPT